MKKNIITLLGVACVCLINFSEVSAQQLTGMISPPASVCIDLTRDIRYQASDTQSKGTVSLLQTFLNKNNYLLASPTGYFGPMTLSAVKKFQAANNINATGFVGPLTRQKIKNISCATTQVSTSTTASKGIAGGPITQPVSANSQILTQTTPKLSETISTQPVVSTVAQYTQPNSSNTNTVIPTYELPKSKADIIITDLSWDPNSLTQSYDPVIKFNFTVKNIGTETANMNGSFILNNTGLSKGSGVFTLLPGESKNIEGETYPRYSGAGNDYRKKAGILNVKLEFISNYGKQDADQSNNYIEKAMYIIPAPEFSAQLAYLPDGKTTSVTSLLNGQVFTLDTLDTNYFSTKKGTYYKMISFTALTTGGIVPTNYLVDWTLKNINTGETRNIKNTSSPNASGLGMHQIFYEPGSWTISAQISDKDLGDSGSISTITTPILFTIKSQSE